MPQLIESFDASNIDPTQGGGGQQLSVGKHPVIIIASELKATKNNDGGYIAFTLQTRDGQTGTLRINLYNNSPAAVDIARKQMSALSHATGVFKVDATEQLHNIPFGVEVALQKSPEAQAKGYTEIVKILNAQGEEPKANGQAQQQNQQVQQQAPANAFAQQQQPQGGFAQQQQPQQQQAPAAAAWGAPAGNAAPANAAPANAGAAAGGWSQGGGAATGAAAPWGK